MCVYILDKVLLASFRNMWPFVYNPSIYKNDDRLYAESPRAVSADKSCFDEDWCNYT